MCHPVSGQMGRLITADARVVLLIAAPGECRACQKTGPSRHAVHLQLNHM